MKKLLLFLFTIFSIPAFSQAPAMEMLIFPKYIEGAITDNAVRNGIPYVYRAKITGLKPGLTYRYNNKLTASKTTGARGGTYFYILPAGNVVGFPENYSSGDFYRPEPTTPGAATNGPSAGTLTASYGEFIADDKGSYTGWFIQETIRNYTVGTTVWLRIVLNDPENTANLGAIATTLHSPDDQPLTVVGVQADDNVTDDVTKSYGTAIRSTAATSGSAKNFVFLYDNKEGEGRPIAGTILENDGVAGKKTDGSVSGYAPFYFNEVNGKDHTWGTMIYNTNASGIRRIEQRSLTTGEVVGYNTSENGVWPDGLNPGKTVSTVNVKLGSGIDGLSAIVLDGSIVTLAPVKNAQEVTFTNTFPATFTVGDADFSLSAISSAGLMNFSYSVASSGILEITGTSVKIIGAGTTVITVTEAGNATIAAGTATKSITVEGLPQTITGLPATLSAIYGDPAKELMAKGGASASPVVYTSDDATIAEIVANKIVFKKEGTVTIRANQAGTAIYSPAIEVTSTLTVAKAVLEMIAENKVKVRGEVNPEATFIYGAFKNEDDESSVTGNPILTMTAETTSPAGEYDINIDVSGLTSGKYTFKAVPGKLSVENKLAQVITFSGLPASAIYGTKPIVFNATSTSTNAITFISSKPGVAIVEKNALGEWTVKVIGAGEANLTASQGGDLTYIPGSASAHITVDKAQLTVTAEDKAKITGANDPIFTVRYDGFVNGDNSDQLSGTLQFTQVADGAAYQIIPSGLSAVNYALNFVTGTLTVGNTAFAPMHKVYGDTPFNPGASSTSGAPVYTVVNTTVASVNAAGLVEIKGAGTTEIIAAFEGGGSATATLQVQKKEVTVTPDAKTKIYAQVNPTLTTHYTGLVNGENENVFTVQPQLNTTAELNSGAGTYAITATGAAANNYSFSYEQGVFTVTKAVLTFTYADLPAVTYGDAIFTPVTTAEFGALPIFSSDNTNVAVIENGSVKIKSAGTANITVSFAGTANYSAGTAVKTLVVAKRMLIVSAESKTRLYGLANPALTAKYDGFVNGETLTAISAPALLTTSATLLSPVGTYTISGSSASALNYIFTYETGILNVEKAVLTVSADNTTRMFGVENPTFNIRYTGFVNGENEAVIENPALATTTAVISSPSGTYSISLAGATDENYTFNYVSGVLTITATGRTITMDPMLVKFVGDADFAPVITLSSGETPVLTSGDVSIATIVDNKVHLVSSGNVTIIASAPANSNYTSAPSTSRMLVVNKAVQTITFEAVPVLKSDGTTYTLKAVSTSGLPVTFKVSDPLSVSLNGNIVTGLKTGKVQITAIQAGDSRFAAANIVEQSVQIIDAMGDAIKIHPALSINGDGVNEFLSIDGIKDFPLNNVTIINRNGLKVFDINGYDNDLHVFKGKSTSGTVLPQGTYFCLIEYNSGTKLKRKTGYFILKY